MDTLNITSSHPHIRQARPSDILRIGIICCAGFRYSPIFGWERSRHEDYPEDTLLSYRRSFMEAMGNVDSVVYVALDKYNPAENKRTSAKFPPDDDWVPPKKDSLVPVSVIWIKLPPGCPPVKDHNFDKDKYPILPENRNRDLNRSHYDSWGKASAAAKRKHLLGYYTFEMLVTHPAYWKRGHATSLVRRGMELMSAGAKLGVNAAGMGASLYANLGFKEVSHVEDGATEDGASGVKTTLFAYDPKLKPQDSDSIVQSVELSQSTEWQKKYKLVISAVVEP